MRRARVFHSQQFNATHEVFNQVPFMEGYNAFTSNAALRSSVAAFAPAKCTKCLTEYGRFVGDTEFVAHAREANERDPVWTPFDRQGRRIDTAKFCESYHALMDLAISHRVPSHAWCDGAGHQGSQVVRCALSYMHYQLEQGTGCPLTMTYAAVPPLRAWSPKGEFSMWVEKLTSGKYDRRDIAASEKCGLTCGMSMTEKQGGSDVRANTTSAIKIDSPSSEWTVAPEADAYSLTGHKWFTSAPMCDAFLTLAQTGNALSCFLVPRWLAPGMRNEGLRFQRLKPKLGDKSNASSEVEYHGAVGFLVGKLGRGVPTIIEMVNHTRLDCLVGSAALMQVALANAVHHTSHRQAFGSLLAEKPLMANVLCDLTLEVEGATALSMRIAAAFDDPAQEQYKRIATAIGKYYVCKRAPAFVYECLECLGGNGYVEEFPLARFYRQAPLNAVWEGSGNVIVADVFRAINGSSAAMEALSDEVTSVGDPLISTSFATVVSEMKAAASDGSLEMRGRSVVEHLALVLEACAVVKASLPSSVTKAFLASRLGDGTRGTARTAQFGTLAPEFVQPDIIARHRPDVPVV